MTDKDPAARLAQEKRSWAAKEIQETQATLTAALSRVSELERELAKRNAELDGSMRHKDLVEARKERDAALANVEAGKAVIEAERSASRLAKAAVREYAKLLEEARAEADNWRKAHDGLIKTLAESVAEADRLRALWHRLWTTPLTLDQLRKEFDRNWLEAALSAPVKAVGTPVVRDTMPARVPPTAAASAEIGSPGELKAWVKEAMAPKPTACPHDDPRCKCHVVTPFFCPIHGDAPPSPPQSPPTGPMLTRITQAEAHCSKCARAYRILDAHGGIWARIEPKPGASD